MSSAPPDDDARDDGAADARADGTDAGAEDGSGDAIPPRVRRVIELVYGVEGVTAARVWQWGDKFAVGVRGTSLVASNELLRRVEGAVAGVREPGETWEFGLLDE